MESASIPLSISSFFSFLFLCSLSLATSDSITQYQSIKDGETVISQGNVFALGFFSPNNSQNRYVGIWYHLIPVPTIVWVANRENPLPDSSGILTIASDGNLVVLDGRTNRTIWSTNSSIPSNSTTKATILDSGNLILRGENTNSSNSTFWQSFQDPSDTLLPGMKIGYSFATRKNLTLRSWKNETDPTPGKFSFGIDLQDSNQFFIWEDSSPHWRSGYWNDRTFNLIPEPTQPFTFHFITVSNENEIYIQYTALYNNTRLVMEVTGEIQCHIWYDSTQTWGIAWMQPKDPCGVYDVCGKNSRCSDYNSPACHCLQGFEPVSSSEWKSGNWRSGCVRKMPLECGDADKFVSLGNLKVPDHEFLVAAAESYDECKAYCIANCSCNAFVYANGSGSGALQCLVWFGTLTDIGDLKENDGEQEIFLRIRASELSSNKKKMVSVIVPVAVVVAILLLGALFYCLRRNLKKKGNENFASFASDSTILIANDSLNRNKFVNDEQKGVDIPFFTFDIIAAATNNFSDSNMLGKGGFGSVYKAELPGGQKVAVKRLSRESGQGLEEFMTEARLIAKLQHRNLVRLLGCSIKRDEKMLLYEYMPNKSLDSFLFDPDRCKALDWEKRFKIILGIARGLLYLHQDSRLRIIHRDLKTSNILLDEDLNPKISDFGMARIFGGDQTEGNTRRVVGTYGYMSPEYASHGLFSEKSDVYSFGIILLEIITGVRNSNFIHSESSSIPEYTWQLWREGNPMELLDPSLRETGDKLEVLKCIHVALLCVQGNAADRPTMASVLAMLISEPATLPTPKEPAFIIKGDPSTRESSKNEITLTAEEGR